MKTAVVTGAGGFIGGALTYRLAEKGYKVYALVISEKEKGRLPLHENIVPVLGNLESFEDVVSYIPCDINYVYHLAWKGISSADYKNIDIQQENILLSINAFHLAEGLKAKKFIFVGSNQEYLMDKNSIDNAETNASIYGVCKMCCRSLCAVLAKNVMEFNSLAFTNVFGPGDASKRTANFFISKLLKGEALDLIEGNNLYDWIFVDDAVDGIIAVGEKGVNNKQYYVGSRGLSTFRRIIEKVQNILSPSSKLNFGKYADNSYTNYAAFALDELFNDTGFECKADFRESILKTAEWVKTLNL